MKGRLGTIRIYTMPPERAGRPGSGCCTPVGQMEDEIERLRSDLERAIPGAELEIIDMRQHQLSDEQEAPVLEAIRRFGTAALPVLVAGGRVISVGPPDLSEIVASLRALLPPLPRPPEP